MEILQSFGVDWKLLLAQFINFAIVVLVLWRFAIKPLTKTMDKRNQEIDKGLQDAKESAERLTKVEQEVKQQLNKAKQAGDQILVQAKQQADKNQQASLAKTKEDVAVIVEQSKKQIKNEKDLMLEKSKTEIAQMVVTALEKVLAKNLDPKVDQKYVAKVLKNLDESR